MEELTDRAKQMLDALKAEETPTKASSDRMWAAVAGGAAAGAIAGLSKGKLFLLGALGVTGVVALVLVAGPGATEEPDTADGDAIASGAGAPTVAKDENEPERAREPALTPAPGPEPQPEPEAAPEPLEREPEPEAAGAKPSPNPGAKREPDPEPSSTTATAGHDSADLERELALLAQAKRTLRGGDAAGALRSLDAHHEEFPRSTFGEERALLRMTALCEVGKGDQARREAEKFLRKNPSSALSEQVRRVCPTH